MAKEKSPGQRAQRKAERPAEILDAAFEEFVARGYAATRVEDIAARVGLTKGAVYFYFETKEDLFEQTLRHVSSPFSDVRQDLAALEGSFEDRIRAFLRIMYDRIATDRKSREMLRFIISEGSRFPHIVDRQYDEMILPLFDAARRLFRDGVEAGELRPSALLVLPEIAASPALLFTIWQMLFSDRKKHDLESFIEAHADILIHGILAKHRY